MAKYYLYKLDENGNYRIVSDRTYMLKDGKLVKREKPCDELLTMVDFSHEEIEEELKYMPVGGILVLDIK